MQTYSKHRPTGFDPAGAFLDDHQDWLVMPVSQTRDSGPLDQSNFQQAIEMLGGESDTVEIHRFGHWGPGWYEIILVDPSDKEKVKIAEEIESSLENYPVLNDEDLSNREYECFQKSWNSWGRYDYQNALIKRVESEFPDGISDDFYDDEVIDQILDMTSEEIDRFEHEAAQSASWEYQPDGNGVTINIKSLVAKTDLDKLVDLAIEQLWETRKTEDIKKLARHLGASPTEQLECVRLGLNRVTFIQQLQQGMI